MWRRKASTPSSAFATTLAWTGVRAVHGPLASADEATAASDSAVTRLTIANERMDVVMSNSLEGRPLGSRAAGRRRVDLASRYRSVGAPARRVRRVRKFAG